METKRFLACPDCGKLGALHSASTFDGVKSMNMECNHCGTEWTEHVKPQSYTVSFGHKTFDKSEMLKIRELVLKMKNKAESSELFHIAEELHEVVKFKDMGYKKEGEE